MSPTPGLLRRAAALGAAWLIFAPLVSAQVASLLARHHEGQTILTWTEVPAVAAATPEAMTMDEVRALRTAQQATSYRVYRSPAPITSVAGLTPIKTVGVLSGWNTDFYGHDNSASHTSASFRYVVDRETGDTTAPTAPTALAGTTLSSTSIALTWTASTDNVGVTGYRIYRDGTQVGDVGTTACTDGSLTAGTTYAYTVAAYDAAGNVGPQSAPCSARTAVPLSPPVWIDFNDGNNYTQNSFIGVGPVAYTPAVGFGWDSPPSATSRWSYDWLNLYRDGHSGSADRTFLVDVPNGRYTVRLYFAAGLLSATDNDHFQVFAEGQLALDLESLPRDPYMAREFHTEVADGQLALRFHDNGGAGNTWCVCGLSIQPGADSPTIGNLSTAAAEIGATVRIAGTGFGTRDTPSPVIWENFETGNAGASLATGGWAVGTSANLPPVYSDEMAYSGTLAGMADFPSGTQSQSTCCAYRSGLSLDEVYVSYHVFIRRNSGVPTRNLKLLRVTSAAVDFLHGLPHIGMTNQGADGQIYIGDETIWTGYVSEGSWHRVELYAKLSTVDQPDGAWAGWIDQNPIAIQDRSMVLKSSHPLDRFRNVALPIYCAHDEGGDYDVFYDDVYIDSSRARIELGNHPDWNQCTNRELQLVTDWAPTAVGFRVRPGRFAEGELVYVLVGDAAGRASAGIPLLLGTPDPASFAEWRAINFLGSDLTNETISGPDADPEGCGLTNLERYAFDLPARGRAANPITLGTATTAAGRVLTLTFPRRTAASDLTYILESSTDLTTWTAVPGRTYTAGSGPITAQDIVAVGTSSRRFLRLRLSASP